MKHLAGSTWGQDLETLALTYKSICRSVMEYAAPIWSPIISKASWTKLQTVQNQALRVITGNWKWLLSNIFIGKPRSFPSEIIVTWSLSNFFWATTHLITQDTNTPIDLFQPGRWNQQYIIWEMISNTFFLLPEIHLNQNTKPSTPQKLLKHLRSTHPTRYLGLTLLK